MEHLELKQLSERTGVSEAKLQFCIDNNLAWRDWLMHEFFDLYPHLLDVTAGIYATLAARFTELGITIDGVRWLMKGITAFHPRKRNPLGLPILADVIAGTMPAFVQIGDGEFVKWKLNHRDDGWYRFHPTVERAELAEPLVVVAIDVAKIRDSVKGHSSS